MKSISSLFKVTTAIAGSEAATDSFCLSQAPYYSPSSIVVEADSEAYFVVDFVGLVCPPIRIRLGNDIIADLPAGKISHRTASEKYFQGYMGESCLTIEALLPDSLGEYAGIYQLDLYVESRPEMKQDFSRMVDELVAIHEGLALDVISRAFTRKKLQREVPRSIVPGAMLEKLESLWPRLSDGIGRIAVQPSSMMIQRNCRSTYRPGDRIGLDTLNSIARDGLLANGDCALIDPATKVNVGRPALSEDIPEHRHIAYRIRRLANVASQIKSHCDRSAKSIESDSARWGKKRGNVPSVFEQVGLPRINQLQNYSARAEHLSRKYSALINQHQFLSEASSPRTPFSLTPLFYGRLNYRSVYQALKEAEQVFAGMVDGDAVRLYFRSFATLYEYWCFIKTVTCLRNWFGPPEPYATYQFVDEVYRPEFTPGQAFEFNTGGGHKVRVTYEPEIWPWEYARAKGCQLGATLTTTSLRPDILVEFLDGRRTLAGMALDAKSGDFFYRQKLRDISDYSRQVLNVQTGGQPIHHVFLLHRDRSKKEETNIPGYFERVQNLDNIHVIGAAPCFPSGEGCPDSLERILRAFLASQGVVVTENIMEAV